LLGKGPQRPSRRADCHQARTQAEAGTEVTLTEEEQRQVLRYRETLITYQEGAAEPLERLKAVVASCTYKPGWSIYLDERERGGEHYGAGYGWTLSISFTVQNSVEPGQITSLHYFPVPPATWDTETWERWVLDCVIDCERHEAMEFIRFGDRAPFFPTHGQNSSNPYLIERK
jgi:hypothetical protein